MINLSSVTKIFGEKKAVDQISFKAKKGEIIGFLGPNGAGKTTTMRLILGYLKPTEGEILVDNHNPIEDRVAVVKKIGYLAENNPLYPEMKVRGYLQFIASVKKDDNWEKIAEAVGLAEVLGKKIEELSRGFKQRVGLAAALLGDPKILILDEPTSGLDPLEQEKMRALIKKLGKEKTIIFSTHILSEVEDVANRLIIINQGKIVYDGLKPKGKGAVEKLFKKVVKN
jgi:ABC-2 type transport system ATP-binding protein